MQRDDQIAKKVGSLGGLSLESMVGVAEPTLQTNVLQKIDIVDVSLKVQKEVRNDSY